MSSTNEGNPPIDMNVTKPNTNEAHAPRALKNLTRFQCQIKTKKQELLLGYCDQT